MATITGSGGVSALGWGVDEIMRRALRGETGITSDAATVLDVEGISDPSLPEVSWPAALVPLEQLKPSELTSRSLGYAEHAVHEALEASGLLTAEGELDPAIDRNRIGVIAGSAAPQSDMFFGLSASVAANGMDSINGTVAPRLSAHSPAANAALQYGLRGPNLAVSAACATGALLVLSAIDQIVAGRADVMVVVAAESPVSAIALTSFARVRALAQRCQPFDRERAGLVFGEGAAAFVVERREHAVARRAPGLATVLGGALTDDARHMWRPDASSWSRTMTLALENAGLGPRDVEYVSAHAAGTRLGDATEVEALRGALGQRADEVPVWSTKGMHGHALGVSGAFEILIGIHALQAGRVPQTVGLVDAGEECSLDHVPDPGRAGLPGILLKDSFGFGGTNCVLALDVHEASR